MQTDDTLLAATKEFIALEEKQLKLAKLPAKDLEILSSDKSILFNGAVVSLLSDKLKLSQERQCEKIKLVNIKTSKDLKTPYVEQRARGAYVATVSQPETAFALSKAAQATNPGKEEAAYLNKCLDWQKKNAAKGLQFVKLSAEGLSYSYLLMLHLLTIKI